MSPHKPSLGIFLGALICFFLPFVQISCSGQKLASFTGIQLVTGPEIEEPQFFGELKTRRGDPEPLAMAAFIAGLIGLATAFTAARVRKGFAAVCGVAGAVCLLILQQKIKNEVAKQAGGLLFEIEFLVGYWLTFILFGAAAALQFVPTGGRAGDRRSAGAAPAAPA